MNERNAQHVYVHLGGQDDNLGDSALRAAYFLAAQGEGRRFHVHLGTPTSDYVSGVPLAPKHIVYAGRAEWAAASRQSPRPVVMFNAGEINPSPGVFPDRQTAIQLRDAMDRGGAVIVAGIGMKDPASAERVRFHSVLQDAAVVSWRDEPSRDAAGFGDVAPDWAYSLGTATSDWAPTGSRPLLAITLRFDRAWPEPAWFEAVRSLAARTSTRIVTLAQVARDAPRAVRLAAELGGEYLVPPSMSHADLDAYSRAIYGQSLAVISDRAHGLIIGATEGSFPIGSAADPQKIARLLAAAGLGDLTGRYDELADFAERLEARLSALAPSIETARSDLVELRARIQTAMRAVA